MSLDDYLTLPEAAAHYRTTENTVRYRRPIGYATPEAV